MKNFKLVIEYDGARYKGWQRLGGEDLMKSIQGKIEAVLFEGFDETIEINGASRTDAGVHARHQVANFKVETEQDKRYVLTYLNAYLPDDIVIKKVEYAEEDFHARFHAKSKTYEYYIHNSGIVDPFNRKYSLHVPEGLDVKQMKEVANVFIGEHDFTTFTTAKSKKKSMVRTIEDISIQRMGDKITIKFVGDGFLHNMVRKITGVIIEAGRSNMNKKQAEALLKSKKRDENVAMAPANGLFLMGIEY